METFFEYLFEFLGPMLILLFIGCIAEFVSNSSKKGKDELKKEEDELKEFLDVVDLYGAKVPLIKKRSPKLNLYPVKYQYKCYKYESKTPYYRTIRIGHAATTEYVDDSGLVFSGNADTNLGYIKMNNPFENYHNRLRIYVTPELYDEFLKTFDDSSMYKVHKSVPNKPDGQTIVTIYLSEYNSSLRASLGTEGYCKYGNYYVEKIDYITNKELHTFDSMQKLCRWFNSAGE